MLAILSKLLFEFLNSTGDASKEAVAIVVLKYKDP